MTAPEHRPPQAPPPGYAGGPTTQFPPVPPQSGPPHGSATPYPAPAASPYAAPAGAGQYRPTGQSQAPQPYSTGPLPSSIGKGLIAVWVLGLISILGVVLGLTIKENGSNYWDSVNAWGGLAILGAVLTLTPALAATLNIGERRAWQVAACGAAALILFWVLFTLPSVGSNTSLLTTIGVGAGVMAAWIAPGRDAGLGATEDPRGSR